jgi:hypothetical protein
MTKTGIAISQKQAAAAASSQPAATTTGANKLNAIQNLPDPIIQHILAKGDVPPETKRALLIALQTSKGNSYKAIKHALRTNRLQSSEIEKRATEVQLFLKEELEGFIQANPSVYVCVNDTIFHKGDVFQWGVIRSTYRKRPVRSAPSKPPVYLGYVDTYVAKKFKGDAWKHIFGTMRHRSGGILDMPVLSATITIGRRDTNHEFAKQLMDRLDALIKRIWQVKELSHDGRKDDGTVFHWDDATRRLVYLGHDMQYTIPKYDAEYTYSDAWHYDFRDFNVISETSKAPPLYLNVLVMTNRLAEPIHSSSNSLSMYNVVPFEHVKRKLDPTISPYEKLLSHTFVSPKWRSITPILGSLQTQKYPSRQPFSPILPRGTHWQNDGIREDTPIRYFPSFHE